MSTATRVPETYRLEGDDALETLGAGRGPACAGPRPDLGFLSEALDAAYLLGWMLAE